MQRFWSKAKTPCALGFQGLLPFGKPCKACRHWHICSEQAFYAYRNGQPLYIPAKCGLTTVVHFAFHLSRKYSLQDLG